MESLTTAAKEDWNADLELELLDAYGKTWLRNVAALGRSSEMPLVHHGEKVLELTQKHRRFTLKLRRVS